MKLLVKFLNKLKKLCFKIYKLIENIQPKQILNSDDTSEFLNLMPNFTLKN